MSSSEFCSRIKAACRYTLHLNNPFHYKQNTKHLPNSSYAPAAKQYQQKYYETQVQTIRAFHSQNSIKIAGDFYNTKERDGKRGFYKAL